MSGYQKVPQKIRQQKTEKRSGKRKNPVRQSPTHEQLFKAPETLRSVDVIAAQQQLGNQVVQRALDKQTAREASTDGQGNLLPDISNEIQQARGSGNSLPKEIQTEVSQSMDQDFSQVRIHTDEKSDKLSRMINARAFTIGKDIFFKRGVFAPASIPGRKTLLHELTHVIQQSGSKSTGGRLKLGAINNSHEHEADRVANKQDSQPAKISATARTGIVQKQGEEEEIQTQAEEEEIQTQAEEEEIQTQAEEEEVQTQAEEEEVQTQPEGGVVQRLSNPFKKKPLSPEEEESRKKTETQKANLTNMLRFGNKDSEHFKDAEHQLRTLHKTGLLHKNPATIALKQRKGDEALRAKIKKNQEEGKRKREEKANKTQHEATEKSAREGDEGALKKLRAEEEQTKQAKAPVQKAKTPKKEEPKVEKHQTAEEGRRESLLNTIKNPRASHEEVQKAEAELRKYHTRFGRSNYANDAISHRRERLEALAKTGHKESQEKLESLNKTNPTKTSKFKSFITGTALPGIKGLLGKALGSASGKTKTLFMGPDSKSEGGEKDEGETKGGGGGGGSGVAEMISNLFQENKKLKEELAALKKGG